jgi:hypothetical protein
MSGMSIRDTRLLLAAAMVVLLFCAQALAVMTAPATGVSSTGRVIGQAGFQYLGGLRTFAAAVLWNRIEPQFHEYYGGVSVSRQTYLVPSLKIITLLDPQFAQSYYISSYVVTKNVGPNEGIAIAREGLANNPRSGLLRANLVQLLFVQDKVKNSAAIVAGARLVMQDDSIWTDEEDMYEGYAIAAHVLEDRGDQAGAKAAYAVLDKLRAAGAGQGSHDHDGDGHQDH